MTSPKLPGTPKASPLTSDNLIQLIQAASDVGVQALRLGDFEVEFNGAPRRLFKEPAQPINPAETIAATSQEFSDWWNQPMPPEAQMPVVKEG